MILAIDPGNEQSAFALMDNLTLLDRGKVENRDMLELISNLKFSRAYIEMIASYGMAVGATVFDTCVWIGRYEQRLIDRRVVPERVFRKDVKMHLCGTMKAKDTNIRQAIIDMYEEKDKPAIGTKKNPGPLYGVSKDVWAAIGVGITAQCRKQL